MSTTRFLLIRHAQTDMLHRALSGRMPGVHLSLAGVQEAAQLAKRLATWKPTALYSSPLERTQETAAPLQEIWNVPLQISEALIEVEFGSWTGKTFEELSSDPLWHRYNSLRSLAEVPGGERMPEVQLRMVKELERMRTKHAGETVAVVSHGDVIRSAVAYYLGLSLDLFQRLTISPASFTTLEWNEGGPQLIAVNQT